MTTASEGAAQRIPGGNELGASLVKKAGGDVKFPELSYEFVGCAMEVHRELGPGQNESFYHLALSEALKRRGVVFQYKPAGKLVHRGMLADEFQADLIVADSLIAELKALESGFAADHFTQLICYLKFWKKGLGLLVDFGKESLVCKRVPYTQRRGEADAGSARECLRELNPGDRGLANSIVEALTRLNGEYAIGYRDTTYIGLLRAELAAEGIPFVENPTVPLSFGQRKLGTAALNCLFVDGRCVVRIHALYDEIHAAQRATTQAYLKHLGAPFGLIANFGKCVLEIRAVDLRAPLRVHSLPS